MEFFVVVSFFGSLCASGDRMVPRAISRSIAIVDIAAAGFARRVVDTLSEKCSAASIRSRRRVMEETTRQPAATARKTAGS